MPTKKKDEKIERSVPANVEAEQILLGAILINNDIYSYIEDRINKECFYTKLHQGIFEAIVNLLRRGFTAKPVTVKNALSGYIDNEQDIDKYLLNLVNNAELISDINTLVNIIHDAYIRRQLIDVGSKIVNTAFQNSLERNAFTEIELAEQDLFNLASKGDVSTEIIRLSESIVRVIENAEIASRKKGKLLGISTGFIELDNKFGGLQSPDLIICAGRPSMGKTALAVNIAVNCARALLQEAQEQNEGDDSGVTRGVAFFSLEMSSEQITARMLAMESGVDASKLRLGDLNSKEFESLIDGSRELHKLPFFIDDTPAITISALRTKARRLKRKHNIGAIFIDYLQLITVESRSKDNNRVQQVSEITKGLKSIAKELEIPVIALSQLSRYVEQREDKRPQLSDLRESGTIEQDADIVMFIFREAYYELRKEPPNDKDARSAIYCMAGKDGEDKGYL